MLPFMILNLATLSRGFHDLLPVPETAAKKSRSFTDGEDFVRCLKRAGIGKIAFLRHGKTSPTAEAKDGIDFNRLLTDEGRGQAKISGASFGRDVLPPYFPTVLVSPAPRTVETAEIFLQAAKVRDDDSVELKPVPEAYDGTMQPEGSALFKKIGYAPLADYIDNQNDSDDRRAAQRVLGEYAHNMLDIIYKVAEQHPCSSSSQNGNDAGSTTTLLFVGHAIYLPAVALGAAWLARCDDQSQELILSKVTNEAEGYVVDLRDEPSTRYLARPGRM